MDSQINQSDNKFIIITTMYNVAAWIEECIRMIQAQSYPYFKCVIIDDLSTDNSVALVKRQIQDDNRFELIVNKVKKFKLRNTCEAMQYASPDDEDIIVIVDGDDRLAHEHVLEKIVQVYRREKCWMTYGSYSGSDGTKSKMCKPYSQRTIADSRCRQVEWRASHLKTFKYILWRKIKLDAFTITEDELKNHVRWALTKGSLYQWYNWRKIRVSDLVDSSGKYLRRCDDKAMMYPMLEMAGARSFFIDEILYIYNTYDKDFHFGVSANMAQRWHLRLIRSILKTQKSVFMS